VEQGERRNTHNKAGLASHPKEQAKSVLSAANEVRPKQQRAARSGENGMRG